MVDEADSLRPRRENRDATIAESDRTHPFETHHKNHRSRNRRADSDITAEEGGLSLASIRESHCHHFALA